MNINWINVSGGKDSTALLLWTLEEELPNCRYVYADTKHEHHSVYEYLDYLEEKTGVMIERVESIGFKQMCIEEKMFPNAIRRFCTRILKVEPLARYMDEMEQHSEESPHLVWVGVRREESASRAKLSDTAEKTVAYKPAMKSYQLIHHPLIDWTVNDVFDIHRRHGVKINPLYMKGARRVGCFPCVLCGQQDLRRMFKVFPGRIADLEEIEEAVSLALGSKATMFDVSSGPISIRDLADMLDEGAELPGLEQESSGCMSVYGLCE